GGGEYGGTFLHRRLCIVSQRPSVAERDHHFGLGRVRHTFAEASHRYRCPNRERNEQHADVGIIDERLRYDGQHFGRETGCRIERIAEIAVRWECFFDRLQRRRVEL